MTWINAPKTHISSGDRPVTGFDDLCGVQAVLPAHGNETGLVWEDHETGRVFETDLRENNRGPAWRLCRAERAEVLRAQYA